MLHKIRNALHCLLAMAALSTSANAAELMITQATDLTFDLDAKRDELVISVLGRLWIMPSTGGEAMAITPEGLTLSHPAVSPDGKWIVAEGSWRRGQSHLWLVERESGDLTQLTDGSWQDHSPSWHPDANHLVFVSDRSGSGDIWSLSLANKTATPVTRLSGDETDPIYGADGASIVFIQRASDHYRLSETDGAGRFKTLHFSGHRLSAPSLRKNGIVITFYTHYANDRVELNALLPVQEMLAKPVRSLRQANTHAPVWVDRDHYLTTARGRILRRRFASRSESNVPFTAWVSVNDSSPVTATSASDSGQKPDHSPYVLRAARVYDPIQRRHLKTHDIEINAGKIRSVVPRQAWPDAQIIDLGDVTVLPGFIDIDAAYRPEDHAQWLAAGVTSVASLRASDTSIASAVEGPTVWPVPLVDVRGLADNRDRMAAMAERQGDRFLTDQITPDLSQGPALLDSLWLEGTRISHFEDHQLLINRSGTLVTSHLGRRGALPAGLLPSLRKNRLWRGIYERSPVPDHHAANPVAYGHLIVAASGESPLQTGLSLIAELLSMHHYGLAMEDVIAASTTRAAEVLQRNDIGNLRVGAHADLVVIDGDPLSDAGALLRPVAVVKSGTFKSIARLLEDSPR
ncbi:MAG: amidohydrolase family protein [Woeseiaceae bacterium]